MAALEEAVSAWKAAGPAARDVFLLNKIEPIMRTLLDTIQTLDVERLTMLGGRGGVDVAAALTGLNEKLKGALGVDLVAAVQRGAPSAPSLAGRDAEQRPSRVASRPCLRAPSPRRDRRVIGSVVVPGDAFAGARCR